MIHPTSLRDCVCLFLRTVLLHRMPTKLTFTCALLAWVGCTPIRMPDPNVRYFAFGDSSTDGPARRDYPELLRDLLGEPADSFANEGNSGETSAEGLSRLKVLFENSIFPNAEVMLYWEGGNDVTEFIRNHDPFLLTSPDDANYPFGDDLAQRLSETQANIERALEAASREGLRNLVATYFLVREDLRQCDGLPLDVILPEQARNANDYVLKLNERIRVAAANQGATLVDVADLDEALRSDGANYFDCNHLSEQGNSIVAELFFQAIVEADGR